MKSLLLIAAVLLVAGSFSSCKKSSSGNPPNTVVGYWAGAYGYDNDNPNVTMSVLFLENGTARVYYSYSGNDTARAIYKPMGNYSYENNVLLFDYPEFPYRFLHKATLNNPSAMEGTWGYLPSETDGGKFVLSKR